ncbi:hypothetical protein NP233_g1449 [Leucocoprinus birnbaumii]|uniref:Nephrocystin 3-like N-terminal domain-containing protein n=1 Tax=Leucocoprinus birnbaumii TaxID=56174 RepID=A0AAD5VZX5_9AGAR|nr:hypothetical protein NP233_g1449 [Leucocoprinus birnbaumii]
MSFFSNAHNFRIHGGNFQFHQSSGQTGIDILYESSTPEASVESEDIYKRICCPGTREQHIADITNWATAPDVEPIFWMKGPAGVGKSSIATTCAQNLQAAEHLGGAFFFSLNGRRSDHTRLFPTLAYQLSMTFPDYHDLLEARISRHKSVVKSTMPSQFRKLIVEPLQQLERQGKPIGQRAIFIDGLDECKSKGAQVEIIEIILASVRDKSTPFRWAVFSREEPRIVVAFNDASASPYYRSAYLPISREIDGEIELYLRNGFHHILRRRNFQDMTPSWPTNEDIRGLVDAAAGLFAHSATVLRYVDLHSYLGFKDALQGVLGAAGALSESTSPFAELDALYMLVMRQIDKEVLPSALLLLSHMTMADFLEVGHWSVALACNLLQFSEIVFRGIINYLHPVIYFHQPSDQPLPVDPTSPALSPSPTARPSVHHKLKMNFRGTLSFCHKSFYDFLVDPTRSAEFCTTTAIVRQELFDRYIRQHLCLAEGHTIEASSNEFFQYSTSVHVLILPSELELAANITYSAILPWPQGDQSLDLYLGLTTFTCISADLSHDHPRLHQFMKDAPQISLQELAKLDYRKALVADIMLRGIGRWSDIDIIGLARAGTSRVIESTEFIRLDNFDAFNSAAFLELVDRLEALGIIRKHNTYHRISSTFTSLLQNSHRRPTKPVKRSGQYEQGRGDRSVIWYWEFDSERRYFHEFRTTDFREAMALYSARRFTLWD